MSSVTVAISLNKDLLKKVEQLRGDVPRSKFVARALEKAVEQKGSSRV
ncbi:MAG: hypothetical protein ABSB56_01075 [Nitrososphaerales archaeon]|jgi:metal-responsive CopG/Arc/MetJ family transcriptional regulator